jgi:hypothetical protein
MSKSKPEDKIVKSVCRIYAPKRQILTLEISNAGNSSLIVHKFSEKSKKQLEDSDQNKKGNRKQQKPIRNKEQEYKDSLYTINNGKEFGLPVSGFKKAMVRAGKDIDGFTMVDLRMSFWIMEDANGMVKIKGKPTMREDMVRLNNKSPQIRYRGEFMKWSATLRILFDPNKITSEELVNLCAKAGSEVGWGELRLEKGYDHGGWTIIGKARVDLQKEIKVTNE